MTEPIDLFGFSTRQTIETWVDAIKSGKHDYASIADYNHPYASGSRIQFSKASSCWETELFIWEKGNRIPDVDTYIIRMINGDHDNNRITRF